MPPTKQILFFLLRLALLAALLLYPWNAVQRAYAGLFRAAGDVVFTRFWWSSEASVRFLDLRSRTLIDDIDRVTVGTLPGGFAPPAPSGVYDTLLVLRNREKPAVFGQLRVSSRALGYWPTAWIIALVLARPMPWRRWGKALLWGLVLANLFVVFRLTVKTAAGGFLIDKPYALDIWSGFWASALQRLEEVVVQNPTASFVVPTFLWCLVSFTWQEWSALRNSLWGGREARGM